jgi:hypothetical protein
MSFGAVSGSVVPDLAEKVAEYRAIFTQVMNAEFGANRVYVREVNATESVTEFTFPNGTTSVVTILGRLAIASTVVSETSSQGEEALAVVTDPDWAPQVKLMQCISTHIISS